MTINDAIRALEEECQAIEASIPAAGILEYRTYGDRLQLKQLTIGLLRRLIELESGRPLTIEDRIARLEAHISGIASDLSSVRGQIYQ